MTDCALGLEWLMPFNTTDPRHIIIPQKRLTNVTFCPYTDDMSYKFDLGASPPHFDLNDRSEHCSISKVAVFKKNQMQEKRPEQTARVADWQS